MADAGFEAVLATVLLLGVAFGKIDGRDFPNPASDIGLAIFAVGLFLLAWLLGEMVKREALGDDFLRALAAGNAVFAIGIGAWAAVDDGFNGAGRAVVWVTAVALLLFAAVEARLANR